MKNLKIAAAAAVLALGCNASTPSPVPATPATAPDQPIAASPGAPPPGASATTAPVSPAAAASSTGSAGATTPTKAAAPIDAQVVATATGAKPETTDGGVVKVSFPRTDVPVDVDGVAKFPPFVGLGSWAAFAPGEKPGVEAMVMGDLVLFEDEVNPVMSALLDHGVEVTALHNHFFYENPRVFFMHIGGEGTAKGLAEGLKAGLDAEAAIRKKTPRPAARSGMKPPPMPSKIDAAKLDAVLGVKGAAKDGLYKATMGRPATAACGCKVGKAMGVATWAGFAGHDDDALVDGDFAVTESELQPVLKALRAGGIDVVAIHHHMTGESPRILFLHYWGRGKAADLAAVVRKAVDLTAWEGKSPKA